MLHVFSANSKKRAIIYTGLKGSFFLGLKRAVHFKQTFRNETLFIPLLK
jgi:hypothetical protein